MIDLTINIDRVIERTNQLTLLLDDLPGAVKDAVERTQKEGVGIAAEELSKDINAEKKEFEKRLFPDEPKRITEAVISAKINLGSAPIPLRRFAPKQTRRGVTYRPYTSGRSRLVRGAFGPNIPRLGGGVFRRQGRKRKPIKKVPGLVLTEDKVAAKAMARAEVKLRKRLTENIERNLEIANAASTSGRRAFGVVRVSKYDAPRPSALFLGFGRTSTVVRNNTRRR